MVLVSYDVSTEDGAGRKRLRRVAKLCEDFGQRVQFSIFECLVEPDRWVQFRDKLKMEIDETKDSLRFYFLGNNWKNRVEHLGIKPGYDPEGTLVV